MASSLDVGGASSGKAVVTIAAEEDEEMISAETETSEAEIWV